MLSTIVNKLYFLALSDAIFISTTSNRGFVGVSI